MDEVERLVRHGLVDRSRGPEPATPFVVKVTRQRFSHPHPKAQHFEVCSPNREIDILIPVIDYPDLLDALGGQQYGMFEAVSGNGHIRILTNKRVEDDTPEHSDPVGPPL